MHDNHTSAPVPGDTDETQTQEHVYQKPESDVDELKQHLIEIMANNQQSFTDQAIDQWRDCFTACLKNTSNICSDVFLYDM